MTKLCLLLAAATVGCASAAKTTRITSVKTDAPVCAGYAAVTPDKVEEFFARAKAIEGWPRGQTLPCDIEGKMLLKNKPVSFTIHPPSSATVMDKTGGSASNYECDDCADLFPTK
jgi:hypothetical protein